MQVITKFELLPNEVLVECFEYLNGRDILYSFYRLNYRFDKLIQSISLQLNFEHVRKTIFDQVCLKIFLNSEIKSQIYSLRLSNDGTCGQIQAFLSFFSLNEFNSLRSLTLIEVEKNNLDKLKSMLPLISALCYVHLIDPDMEVKGELSPRHTYRVETIPKTRTRPHLPLIFEISSLTNLTLSDCSSRDISQLFKYAPMLKCLTIRDIGFEFSWTNYYTDFSNHCAIHLKQLIMMKFRDGFSDFKRLVKQTPNLKILTITSIFHQDFIDAPHWQRLITSSLPQLSVFKFEFECNWYDGKNAIFEKSKEFQSDFWQEQHHWYTECSYYPCIAIIYTIPHVSYNSKLPQYTPTIYYYDLQNKSNTLDNETDLTIFHKDVTEKYHHYVTNVTSLTLLTTTSSQDRDDNVLLGREYFESLKMIVDLSSLKHLSISWTPKVDTSVLLLQILKEAPKLSSMDINLADSTVLFSDRELRKYLSKKIKKLKLCSYPTLFINNNATEEFCKTFSNIEQLTYNTDGPRYLLLLLKRLSKLSIMKVSFNGCRHLIDLSSFENEARKLNVLFRIERMDRKAWNECTPYKTDLSIWIGNNIK